MYRDTRVRFIRYNNQVYQFNGRNRMRAFTGKGWRLAGISKPSAPATAPASGAAGNLTGVYRYYITAANTRVVLEDGRYVESLPVLAGADVDVTALQVTVTLPTEPPDPQADKWIIYRNKSGEMDADIEDVDLDFFKVAEVAITTVSTSDNIADDSLTGADRLRFTTEIPPTFKYAAIFANHLIGTGFDEFTTGTATVLSDPSQIQINGAGDLPDGLVGCYFKKRGEDRKYTITGLLSSTRLQLDADFEGGLSAENYTIFRDPSEVWPSEFDNPEGHGEEGEVARNKLLVGGPGSKLKTTGIFAAHGVCYVFTLDQVYVIYGTPGDLRMGTDPVLDGIGCVSHDTIVEVDGTLYWLSLQGPVAYNPNATRSNDALRIGEKLGPDWLEELNVTGIGLAAAGYNEKLHRLKFSVPLSGESVNGKTYVYDVRGNTWWVEPDWNATLYWRDFDSNGEPRLFSAAQRKLYMEDHEGTYVDGVPSGTTTATVTGWVSGTKTITASAAAFYTTGYGLEGVWVFVYRKPTTTSPYPYTFVGKSKVASNAGTTLVIEDALNIQVGDTVYVGAIRFKWKTPIYSHPSKNKRSMEWLLRFAMQGESGGSESEVWKLDIPNADAASDYQAVQVLSPHVQHKLAANQRGPEYQAQFEIVKPGARIAFRSMVLEEKVAGSHK